MKISLQIILADARSPGRGLPPQPFDRHISGELPNLDNIIQESESQYGDSARADTIQLPRAARQPGRGAGPSAAHGDRSLCSRSGLHGPTAQSWGSGRGPAIPASPLRVPPQPRLPTSGSAVPSLGCVNSPQDRIPPATQACFGAPRAGEPRPRVSLQNCPPAPREDPPFQLVSPRLSI